MKNTLNFSNFRSSNYQKYVVVAFCAAWQVVSPVTLPSLATWEHRQQQANASSCAAAPRVSLATHERHLAIGVDGIRDALKLGGRLQVEGRRKKGCLEERRECRGKQYWKEE